MESTTNFDDPQVAGKIDAEFEVTAIEYGSGVGPPGG